MSLADTTAPAPGWYPDPSDASSLRWWDGTGWTTFIAALPPEEPEAAAESLASDVARSDDAAVEPVPELPAVEPPAVEPPVAAPMPTGLLFSSPAVEAPVAADFIAVEPAATDPIGADVLAAEFLAAEVLAAERLDAEPVAAEAVRHLPNQAFRAALAAARVAREQALAADAAQPRLDEEPEVTPPAADDEAAPEGPSPAADLPARGAVSGLLGALAREKQRRRADVQPEPESELLPESHVAGDEPAQPDAETAAPAPAGRSKRRRAVKGAAAVALAAVAGGGGAAAYLNWDELTATAAQPPSAERTVAAADPSCVRLWNVGTSESAAQLRVTLGQFTGALARVSRVAPLGGTLMEPDSCALTVYEPTENMHATFVAGVKGEDGYIDVTTYPRAGKYGWPTSEREANVRVQPDGSLRAIAG